MRVERYRFHCTDGEHVIVDQAGRPLAGPGEVYAAAESTALALMASCGGGLDWSGWLVDVHDVRGRRALLLGFRDVRGARRAA
ncbi:DUF6894 family protein [Methylobacterium planeticum]|uniref:DUF6894 domain-containing protein n=1 Tax=Methylobacterium planeticum TaxID=2615211 RepID=A0A6N6MLU7_9HYPH|nr:hypothetical protein [Methylobacterium planeticum]KAB1069227.1 hypothetical protein F6X51_25880 [Methylobacterium planeticum]